MKKEIMTFILTIVMALGICGRSIRQPKPVMLWGM